METLPTSKTHIGSYFIAEVIDENKVLFTLTKDLKIDVGHLQEAIECQTKLMEGRSFHSILDLTKTSNLVSRAAGKLASIYDRNTKEKLSQSVIVDSIGKSMLIGIFQKTYGYKKMPFRTFDNLQDALNWINQSEEERL